MFVVIEGPDGSGKTSVQQELERLIIENNLTLQNPYLTFLLSFPKVEKIRTTLLHRTTRLSKFQELCLFAADFFIQTDGRAFDAKSVIYIADRYYYSTLIHQILALNVNRVGFLAQVVRSIVLDCPAPDFLFLLHTDNETLDKRLSEKNRDVMEINSDYVYAVRREYAKLDSIIRDRSEYIPNQSGVRIHNFDSGKLTTSEIAKEMLKIILSKK